MINAIKSKKKRIKDLDVKKSNIDLSPSEPINPILFDTVSISGEQYAVNNIFNVIAGYYSEQKTNNLLQYTIDLEHRRYAITQIFENRVRNCIIQAYREAFTITNEYSGEDRLSNSGDQYAGNIHEFIKNVIDDRYRYILDINSFLPGGLFTNRDNITDCLLAISTAFDIYVSSYLDHWVLNHKHPSNMDESESIYYDQLLVVARANLSKKFLVCLAKHFKKVMDDFEIYYSAGCVDRPLKELL